MVVGGGSVVVTGGSVVGGNVVVGGMVVVGGGRGWPLHRWCVEFASVLRIAAARAENALRLRPCREWRDSADAFAPLLIIATMTLAAAVRVATCRSDLDRVDMPRRPSRLRPAASKRPTFCCVFWSLVTSIKFAPVDHGSAHASSTHAQLRDLTHLLGWNRVIASAVSWAHAHGEITEVDWHGGRHADERPRRIRGWNSAPLRLDERQPDARRRMRRATGA